METTIDIAEVLLRHAAWWAGEDDGAGANLRMTNLSKATMPDGSVHE